MPKSVEVVCVFNRVHGFWGKKSCFSGKLQREKLLLCRGRTCAARSCKVNGHLRESRGPALVGAQRAPTVCKQTRSCGCLPRRGKHCSRPGFVPLNRGPTLTTPQCPAPTTQLGSSSASTRQPFSVGTRRTVVTVAVSGTIVSSPAQPAKSSLSQVSTT